MKLNIKILLIILFSHIAIWSSAQKDTSVVYILHMNDLHGKIERLAQTKHIVDSIKSENKDVFLFSAGDLFSGNPIVDRHEKRGWPIIDVMNDVGFDISAIGNHEFDFGQTILNDRRKEANFKFISSNIDASKAELDQPEPYTVFKTSKGLEIAVISAIQLGKNGLPSSHPSHFKNVKFTTAVEALAKHKKELNAYDMQVALTHLGYRKDIILAEEHPWLDLIIGGHSHTTLDPATKIGKAWVTQAGSNVKYLGVNTVVFVGDKLVSITNELLPLKNKIKDPEIDQKVKEYEKAPALQIPLAYLPYDIDSPEEIGELMANAYKEGLSVDMAFQNIGGVRISRLKEDTIKLKNVMYLDPFNNEIMIFEMTEKDILSFLRYAFTVRQKNNQLIAGLKAEFKTNERGELADVVLTDTEGNPLDKNKKYRVAINSYMADSYDFSVKENAQYTATFSNDLIIDYLKKYFPLKK
jgi:2',3'-cyclic-nucleotide 2'-phosphodiesterase (5'-nucleotidase family)